MYGGPVGNESKKHEDVGDSTPPSEYMALYWCGRRGRWWYQLIYEMDKVCHKRGIEPKLAKMVAEGLLGCTEIMMPQRDKPKRCGLRRNRAIPG